ncbi:hypothetical protein SmJEL517_g05604 [Synchytrium microbalum]|uniref:SAC domain-containing protein n=1 Tax=Synchytrium microbalum TaxID=1806994 RepID=A0A507BUI8_9FUNG|nr:uncharacterized protein SmJEL517_g05604 [Synchytrium microbalum]TPX30958.1 hypothetical protein SmJEL517_g05604 [Synchytrium microbalum]
MEEALAMNRFMLYETKSRYYVVGTSTGGSQFRVLKIDRTDAKDINIVADPTTYSEPEVTDLLNMIAQGNTNDFRLVTPFYALMGFIRFLEGHYMILVTKRKVAAVLGGHCIHHIEGTMILPVWGPLTKVDRKPDETRYTQLLATLDLTKGFYFSYTYDLSQTLQLNLTGQANSTSSVLPSKFVWNTHLLESVEPNSEWFIRVIYGFVGQFKISVLGRPLFVTLIARRSRQFAGARFFRRGVNDKGAVANEVETEQIVHDGNTTSFFSPAGRLGHKPSYTSFVQHRGSIPLFWSQEPSNVVAKPPIELTRVDPYFSAAAMHFDDLFYRYGPRVICLNLVKAKEKTPRESKLLHEYTRCVQYLNQFLPDDRKIKYYAFDMARATKSDDQNVIEYLENFADKVLATTGFFHSGAEPFVNALRAANSGSTEVNRILARRQNGVVRTNCIDCLDRTNAAQFLIGKCALGHQLHALGLLSSPKVPFDTDATILFNQAYHEHGDVLAMQYGGSHLVNTMENYRKMSDWQSQSRDMYESVRRWASNSFTDAEKQDAINLFLGTYVPYENTTALWDMKTDFFLHNEDPRSRQPLRSYTQWWTANSFTFLNDSPERPMKDSYFEEYYRLRALTTFAESFAFTMNSTTRILRDDSSSLSPFVVRVDPSQPTRFSMGDVKRFVTLKNKEQTDEAPSIGPTSSGKQQNGSGRDQDIDWTSTKSVALRMLYPKLSSAEFKNYKRYTSEFSTGPLAPPADIQLGNALSPPQEIATTETGPLPPVPPHPEASLFASWVKSTGVSTSHYDKSLYNQYCTTAKTSYWISATFSENQNAMDSYGHWLKKGQWNASATV